MTDDLGVHHTNIFGIVEKNSIKFIVIVAGLELSNFRGTAILALRFLSKIGHQGHTNFFFQEYKAKP